MKRITVFIVFCFFVFTGFGQNGFMSLSMGASVPVGDFAKSGDLYTNGFAGTNFVLNFDGAYFFTTYLGIGGTFSFGSNYGGGENLQNQITKEIPSKFPELLIPFEPVYNFNIGQWNYVNLMAGPQILVPLYNIGLDFKALGGLSFITSPEREVTLQLTDGEFTSSQENRQLNFGYILGSGLRFGLGRSYSIRLSMDYFYSKTSLEIINAYQTDSTPVDLPNDKYDLAITSVHAALGITYNF
ncbi:MAG: hypothetical protein KAX05_08895 [Bacteroidales bacterium]|nr:hypothetical protein [Bacteroidales bacterium]